MILHSGANQLASGHDVTIAIYLLSEEENCLIKTDKLEVLSKLFGNHACKTENNLFFQRDNVCVFFIGF